MGDDRTRFKDVQDAQVFGPKSRNDNLNFQGNMNNHQEKEERYENSSTKLSGGASGCADPQRLSLTAERPDHVDAGSGCLRPGGLGPVYGP